MLRSTLWLCAALLAAQTALAQPPGGGMGGRGGGRPPGGMGGAQGARPDLNIEFPSAIELQDYNPASLLLEKHRRLRLTDAQRERLTELQFAIFVRNASLLGRYDSLQRAHQQAQTDRESAGSAGGSGGGSGGGPRRGGGPGGGARGGRGGGSGGPPSDPAADSIRMAAMRPLVQLRALADSLEERRRADVRDVLDALSENPRRKKAAKYLAKQDKKFAREFPTLPTVRGRRDSP